RFFWLSDKISGVTLQSGKREFGLEILPKYPSDSASLLDALSKVDFKVDGLLSFHRKSKYSLEASVCAMWLKLDMLPELLGFSAPPEVSFKPSTEKERKQRAYFIGLKENGKGSDDTAEASPNTTDDAEAALDDNE
ncbi:hypothetical protein EGW08_002440, partial [Elysia chlorotica]